MSQTHKRVKKRRIIVRIKKSDIDYAKNYASQSTRFNHYLFFIGKLGERCVIKYLRKKGIYLSEDWTEVNRVDQYDIGTISDIIDVKTTSKSECNQLLIPKYTFNKGRKFSFYIAVKLNENLTKAEICGYATKRDIENASVITMYGKRMYCISYKKLKPFEELVNYLKKSTRT